MWCVNVRITSLVLLLETSKNGQNVPNICCRCSSWVPGTSVDGGYAGSWRGAWRQWTTSVLCTIFRIEKSARTMGHWVCWMSTGRKDRFMWRTHTRRLPNTGLPGYDQTDHRATEPTSSQASITRVRVVYHTRYQELCTTAVYKAPRVRNIVEQKYGETRSNSKFDHSTGRPDTTNKATPSTYQLTITPFTHGTQVPDDVNKTRQNCRLTNLTIHHHLHHLLFLLLLSTGGMEKRATAAPQQSPL